VMDRILTSIKRGSARADTFVAVVLLVVCGHALANDRWILMAITGVLGLVFMFASGDFSWRKGYVAGKRDAGAK